MSVAVAITFERDTASTAVAEMARGLKPEQLNPIVGRSARNVYRTHLFGVNESRPNRLGGSRTNFYGAAARATHFTIENDQTVIVSMPQVGLALRFYGGTVKPVTKKYLTEPATAAAHGHRASEFDLELVFGKGGEPYALALTRNRQRDRAAAGLGRSRGPAEKPVIMFSLKKETKHTADPTILPYNEQVLGAVNRDVLDHAHRTWQRGIEKGRQGPGNGLAGGAS